MARLSPWHPTRVGEMGCRATFVDFEGEIMVKTGDKTNERVRDSKLATEQSAEQNLMLSQGQQTERTWGVLRHANVLEPF